MLSLWALRHLPGAALRSMDGPLVVPVGSSVSVDLAVGSHRRADVAGWEPAPRAQLCGVIGNMLVVLAVLP